jgi:hypothetical protein
MWGGRLSGTRRKAIIGGPENGPGESMTDETFKLRYVGQRFHDARLPVDVLSDLPAFRDLLVAFAKDRWRALNSDRRRVPKGFDKSLSFDLVGIEEGSAVPALNWNRGSAQDLLPGFVDELQHMGNASNSLAPPGKMGM